MTKLRWNKRTGEWGPKPERDHTIPLGPMVIRDIEPYMSPCGTGEISSRSWRREDLKANGCREVEPDEKFSVGAPRPPSMLEQTAAMDRDIDPQGAAMIDDPSAIVRGAGTLFDE